MRRWLIGLVLGLGALAAVFVLWNRERTEHVKAASPPAAVAPDPAGSAGDEAAQSQNAPSPETAPPAEESGSLASAEGIIVIDEPWARPAAASATTAAYMLMTNTSQGADRIASVFSPDAAETAIHETRLEAKKPATRPAPPIDLEPGAPLVFEPGGLYVMLSGLKHALKEGDRLTLIFTFQHAGRLEVQVPVGEMPAGGDSVLP